jgi:hypothetical protein
MPLEALLEMLRHRPFVPFRIHLTDGSTYEVRHPDLAMPGARSVLIGIPSRDLPEGVYDRFVVLALVHITQLEPLGTATASA